MIPSFGNDVRLVLDPGERLSVPLGCSDTLPRTIFLALPPSSAWDMSCAASEEAMSEGYSLYEQCVARLALVHCIQGSVLEHLSFFLLHSKQDNTGRGRFCGILITGLSGPGEDAESIRPHFGLSWQESSNNQGQLGRSLSS
jgi:hypothetical protein